MGSTGPSDVVGSLVNRLAGPTLIVAGVLVVLRDVAFSGLVSAGDAFTFFLPSYCFMGTSLASGHIPAWNPYTMAGTPFAADPQSGWLYAPAMLLFTTLPCDVALRTTVVALPMIAGLGMYWFLRLEEVSRPAATVAGLALSLSIAGSNLAVSLPFAGTLAWTAVALACCSRYFRARSWPNRILWAGLTSLAWGQLAAAHFSGGLVIGTAALLTYVVAKGWKRVREDGLSRSRAALLIGFLVFLLPLFNLAFLVPRLAYLPATSLGAGYGALQDLSYDLSGVPVLPPQGGAGLAWPLKLATSPGAHLGAVTLMLAGAGFWSRRHRALAVAFASFGVVGYVLSLEVVAEAIPPGVGSWRVVDLYLHGHRWFGYGAVFALALLGGLGVEAWREAAPGRSRLLPALPGTFVWLALPPVLGVAVRDLAVLALGAVGGALVLGLSRPGTRLLALVPAILAVELTANGLLTGGSAPFGRPPELLARRPPLVVWLASHDDPGPIARALGSGGQGRYVTIGPPAVQEAAQFTSRNGFQNQSLQFGLENSGGYSPIQLLRYWVLVRALDHPGTLYNRAILVDPPVVALDLLHVVWVVAPASERPPESAVEVARDGQWILYRRIRPSERASLVASWTVVDSPSKALGAVLSPGFDPINEVVLEEDPGMRSPGAPHGGEAVYRQLGPQAARVAVEGDVPSMLLVRNAFDRGWRATIDGRPSRVLRANYAFQAVPVPAGRHEVHIFYSDPWIGRGLVASAVVVGALIVLAAALRRRGLETRKGNGPESQRQTST